MKNYWWKILTVILLYYTLIGGLLINIPDLPNLEETARNLFFHVPMWFGMIILTTVSAFYSVKNLRIGTFKNDLKAVEFARGGLIFGVLGIITGMVWANFTWGEPWSGDPKQNGALIFLLIYSAYFVLRSSLKDEKQRGRIGGVYNIFAFATLIPLLFILPRITESLHPGSGDNPSFAVYDLDNMMRMVFYPAVIGWALLGTWIISVRVRIKLLNYTSEV